MSLRAICFDFFDTLAYMAPSHLELYVSAAAERGVSISEELFRGVLDSAWDEWRTPTGIDHSAASGDERSFRAVRVAVHASRLRSVGVDRGAAGAIAERVAELEAEPRHYHLFPDAVPALDRLAGAGIESIIVSNHIWRLPQIVDALGVTLRLRAVLTSARVGYRKPHPAIYAAALSLLDHDPSEVLFVGDSLPSDVEGPRAAGMRALLLDRRSAAEGEHTIRSLAELPLE